MALDEQPIGELNDGKFMWNTDGGPSKWRERREYCGPLYAAAPADLLEIHRILQCVADCPPVDDSDSKVLLDFKSYCHAMNGIAERVRAQHAGDVEYTSHPSHIESDETGEVIPFDGGEIPEGFTPLFRFAPPATPDKVAGLVEALEQIVHCTSRRQAEILAIEALAAVKEQ